MNYTPAKAIADHLVLNLRQYCTRIEIAGSVRRMKPDVHDIEIVCEPILQPVGDLFGQPAGYHSMLNDRNILGRFGTILKGGEKYAQIALPEGINLDLFMVTPPALWGVILTIRTGPADFSKRCVTQRCKGGYLPSNCNVHDGNVWIGVNQEPIGPEEIDFLNFLGLGWIEPENRT